MRAFSGPEQFDALKKTIVDSYRGAFPAEKGGFKLNLKKIWVDDKGLANEDYGGQKNTKIKGQTWGAPVYANLQLKDPSGKILDHHDNIRLATIPKLTPRGSYIVDGNEYQISNQLLRKMGAYVVRRATGDQYKINYNLGGDNTKNFEVHFDPTNNKYSAKVDQGKIPLYPLLSAIGIPDSHLRQAWGSEIFAANKKESPKDTFKYAEKFARVKTDNIETARDALKSYLKRTIVDPHVTEATIGKKYTHLSPLYLVDTTKKLLNVYRNKAQPDDPENLLFKEVLSVEDMIHDRLNHPKSRADMQRMLTRHLGRKNEIKHLIDFKKLTAPVTSFFTRDDRSNTSEQYNPMHMLTGTQKLTIMGTGGIREAHMISPEVRQVHPSHLGFIDPIHTPECFDEKTEVFTSSGWKKWTSVSKTDLFACKINGRLEFHPPEHLHSSKYSGPMYGVENNKINYLVTPNHRMWVRPLDSRKDAWRFEYAPETHQKPRTFNTTHEPYFGNADKPSISLDPASGGNAIKNVGSIDIGDWCEFMGWFLSEGSVVYNEKTSSYFVGISQSKKVNPDNCNKIESLLDKLPWSWCSAGR